MSFLQRLFGQDKSGDAVPLDRSEATATCPYCEEELKPPPKRTRKCPHCSERIIRRNDWDGKASHISYLTEDQAREAHKEEIDGRIGDLRKEATRAAKRAKRSGEASDWADASAAYISLAADLATEGMPYWKEKTLSDQALARGQHVHGRTKVDIDASHCCDACKEFHGKVVSVSEALTSSVIPEGVCTASYCRCDWIPHIG
jgi:hypothetical protein